MTDQNDPLAMPASVVPPPSFPKLKPELLYNLEITSSKVGMNKDQTGETWSLVLKTTKDELDTEGKNLNKGFPLYHYVGLTPTEKRTGQRIAEDAGQIIRCALGKDSQLSVRGLMADPSVVVGKVICCKVGLRKANDDFPESNVIKTFVEVKGS